MRLWTGVAAFACAMCAGAALVLAGPAYRFGVLDLGTAFLLLRLAAYGGMAAVVLALIGLVLARRSGAALGLALVALIIGAVAVGLPWWLRQQATAVPPIHDITTDPTDPPEFVAIRPLRSAAPNPVDYPGEQAALQQREAYPDLGPMALDLAPDEAYDAALDAAEAMDWELVAQDSGAGRIEATATTAWFGFKDDVVIRVRPADGGSRIDVRSKSRVGQGDLGANAARIRSYIDELEDRLAGAARGEQG
jgi:uncharacterized protein (DUF1499 family)